MNTLENINSQLLVLKSLFNDIKYVEKYIIHLNPKYFEEEKDVRISTVIKNYYIKFKKLITHNAMYIYFNDIEKDISKPLLDIIFSRIEEIKNVKFDGISDDFLYEVTEKFFRDRAIFLAIFEAAEILEKKGNIIDILPIVEHGLAVNFDLNVGHDYIDNMTDRFEWYNRVDMKYPTHLDCLNRITGGGLMRKTINVVLGQPGVGKSRFLIDISSSYLKKGMNVLYITFELSEMVVAQRYDSNVLDLNINELPKIDKGNFLTKIESLKSLSYGKLIIKEYPVAGANTFIFRQLMRDLKIKKDFIPDVIVIDYISIAAPIRSVQSSNTYLYNKIIAEEFRALATETNTIVLTAAQLNRGAWDSSDISMSNVAESAGIMHTSDFVIAIGTTDEMMEKKQVVMKVLKNRLFSLSSGKRKMILGYDDERMKHYEVTNVNIDDELKKIDNKFKNIKFDDD